MPAPIVLGILALCAGGTGAGAAASGIKDYWKLFKAKKETNKRCRELMQRAEAENTAAAAKLEELGTLELQVIESLGEYSALMGKIQNRPEFTAYHQDDFELVLPQLDELNSVTLVAHTLLGNLGGVTAGTLGGIAAAGAVPSIVAAVGTSGTGTAISTLSGAAAWNAILAAMGGGTLAAGGGGIALGSAILGSLTCGVGILVGGVVIKLTGKKALEKQKQKFEEKIELTEENVECLCGHFREIARLSDEFSNALATVKELYDKQLHLLFDLVETRKKTDGNDFSRSECLDVQNTTLLVCLLYKMCRIQLTRQTEAEDGTLLSEANTYEVDAMISYAESVIDGLNAKPSAFSSLFRKLLGRK